jgi:hypothetical protein
MMSLLARSRDHSPSRVIQVFTVVAWQHEVRRCNANSDLFTARLGSAILGTEQRKHCFVYYCVIAGVCFDVTVLVWRKYAPFLRE